MNTLGKALLLVIFPVFAVSADQTRFEQSAATTVELHYAGSKLSFLSGPMQKLSIDHKSWPSQKGPVSFIATAQAAALPDDLTLNKFDAIYDTVNQAGHLEDIKEAVTKEYYQSLLEKSKAGVSQFSILAALTAMRPTRIRVLDFYIQGDRAQFIVDGKTYTGVQQGSIDLLKNGGKWQISSEAWFTADAQGFDPVSASLGRLPGNNNVHLPRSGSFISRVSPDYKIKRGFLALNHVPYRRRKEALNFVFLMNNDNAKNVSTQEKEAQVLEKNNRARMHLMWTGSRRMFTEQRVIKNEYPIDFTFSQYDDGYSSEDLNLVLPNKKPRELLVSLLWSF